MRSGLLTVVALAFASTAVPALAQAELTRKVTISFDATVAQGAVETLQVRDASGALSPYTGALPSYPLQVGDRMTFTIEAELPTRAFYDNYYQGTPASDGLYKLPLVDAASTGSGGSGPFVGISRFTVSDPLRPTLNFGQPTTARLGVVYDYNTDSYSLDPGVGFVSGAYGAPGFLYDAATGQFTSCSGAQDCRGSAGVDPVIFSLFGNADFSAISANGIRVNSTDPTSPTGMGFFDLLFSGSWNLPVFGAAGTSGGGTPVPEPSMLLLFGAGAGAVFSRRRKRVAS